MSKTQQRLRPSLVISVNRDLFLPLPSAYYNDGGNSLSLLEHSDDQATATPSPTQGEEKRTVVAYTHAMRVECARFSMWLDVVYQLMDNAGPEDWPIEVVQKTYNRMYAWSLVMKNEEDRVTALLFAATGGGLAAVEGLAPVWKSNQLVDEVVGIFSRLRPVIKKRLDE